MKSSIAQLAAIVCLSGIGAGATYLMKGQPARSLVCDPASLKEDEICLQQIDKSAPVLWVDARSREAWMRDGVPGSILWNLDPTEDMQAFEAENAVRIFETPRVIVYCGDENCGVSRQVADRIRALDLGAEISVLHGGWRALSEAGWLKDSSPKP